MSSTARAVVAHDLDHIAEEAERVNAEVHHRVALDVADAADALHLVVQLAPVELATHELAALTTVARTLGRILATIDPERPTA